MTLMLRAMLMICLWYEDGPGTEAGGYGGVKVPIHLLDARPLRHTV